MARKILLADDSVTAQNMGRRILTDAGYDVTTVNNGSAALKKAAEQKPDLIVLDVYMPGYGGLEVCQRLREAPETARIPILLTVGKLEPFKPDEARRVRADAYVIKPFEASELLAALTKMEDRIVPEGPPSKSAKNGKNSAADSFTGKGERFGDSETGWKNRLNIPPVRKANAAEADAPASAPSEAANKSATNSAEAEKVEAPKTEIPKTEASKEGKPEAAASSAQKLPSDITPEEITALASAAAAVRLKENTQASSATAPAPAQDTKTELPAATSLQASAPLASSETNPAAEKSAENEKKETSAENEKKNAGTGSGSPPKIEPAAMPEPAESEVAAVLAALTPFENKDARKDEVPVSAVAYAGALAEKILSGPRWIAQEIPLSDQDATSALDREMEKANAAVPGASSSGLPSEESSPSLTQPAISAENSSPSSLNQAIPVVPSSIATATTESNPMAIEALPASGTTEVISQSDTQNNKQDAGNIASSAVTSSLAAADVPKEPAALAAAASAQPSAPEAISADKIKSETPVSQSAEPPRESQLAAAWENWQTVRESILGSQLASQITEAASETLKEAQKEQHPAAAPEPKFEASTTGPVNPTSIANIVDSVLAELKPKLMEEIARKLGNEKK